jgi:hypothetical protein
VVFPSTTSCIPDVQPDYYMSEFGVSKRGERSHPHVSARPGRVVVGGLWRQEKNGRVTLLHGINDVPLEDRISAACKHFQNVYRQITAESHSLPTSNTYGGEDKEDKSTKSTLLGLCELFSIGNQLSCCQKNVDASPKSSGLNHRETHANTVSNQKAPESFLMLW